MTVAKGLAFCAVLWATLWSMGPALAADAYTVDTLVKGSAMKGVHGLAFDRQGALHAISITGMSIYKVDVDTGAVTTVIGPPLGVGDDLAFGPDGSLAWTARDKVYLRNSAGDVRTVADKLDGLNSINFGPDGRLFFTRIFRADALLEGYADGRPPRVIAEKLGGLNGFEVTAAGKIIGPRFMGDAILSVDVDTGATAVIADGLPTPAAVNLLSNGDIIALGYRSGIVMRIDAKTGAKRTLATLAGAPIDNLAIDRQDRIYISHSSFNGITRLDPDTGAATRVVWGELSAPGGLAAMTEQGREVVLAADAWGHRTVDPGTGAVQVLPVAPTVFGSVAIAADEARIITANTTPGGMVQIVERATGKALNTLFGFGAPYGVLAMPDNGLLVADFTADALIAVGAGEKPPRTTVASGLGGVVGLARGAANMVYVTGHSDGTVSRVDLGTGARTVVASGLSAPEGLAVLPDGKLAVAEVGKARLVIVDPASGAMEVAADNLPVGYDLGGAGPAPALLTGVAATSDGAIFVTGDANNSLIRVRPR